MTKVEFDFISDAGIFIFFEKDMRVGVSYISKRYKKPTINIESLMTQNKNQNILHNHFSNYSPK